MLDHELELFQIDWVLLKRECFQIHRFVNKRCVIVCVYLPFQAGKPQASLNKIKPELEIHIWKENSLIEG